MKNKVLAVIPARGGSKGIPKKNIKELNGKPLIYYTIEVARAIFDDVDICVSTDDDEIINIVEKCGLEVPFKRPKNLAADTATTNDVLLHAIQFYESKNIFYDTIVLMQPTSPLRTAQHVKEAMSLYREDIDMVVSVKESHATSVLCHDNKNGYLELFFNKSNKRRQEMPLFYEYNGAIYVINVQSLKKKGLTILDKKIKYIMPTNASIDIDTNEDWNFTEYLLIRHKNN